jgi:hypothetical protein
MAYGVSLGGLPGGHAKDARGGGTAVNAHAREGELT